MNRYFFFDSVTGLVLKTLGNNMAATSLKTKSAKDREEEIESSHSLEFFFFLPQGKSSRFIGHGSPIFP